jgi:hypothetical protein
MLSKRLKAVGLWNDKQIWCPDIIFTWVIAIGSVTSIAVFGPTLGA